jgi:spore coat protein CotF
MKIKYQEQGRCSDMSSFFTNKVKDVMDMSDEVISHNMLVSIKSAADAYLNATMTSSTPELRALYADNLTKLVAAHTAIMELSVNRGWVKPYDSPMIQLSQAREKANKILES